MHVSRNAMQGSISICALCPVLSCGDLCKVLWRLIKLSKLFVVIYNYVYSVHNHDIPIAHSSVVYWDLLTRLLTWPWVLSISFFLPVAGCIVRMRPRRCALPLHRWRGHLQLVLCVPLQVHPNRASHGHQEKVGRKHIFVLWCFED